MDTTRACQQRGYLGSLANNFQELDHHVLKSKLLLTHVHLLDFHCRGCCMYDAKKSDIPLRSVLHMTLDLYRRNIHAYVLLYWKTLCQEIRKSDILGH